MKKGYGLEGKYSADPIGSEKPRGKARSQRKASRDGRTLTPTEQHRKNALMKQFMVNPEGGGIGNSEAYKASPAWCSGPCNGRRLAIADGLCLSCGLAAHVKANPDPAPLGAP